MKGESSISSCGYYDLHILAKKMKLPILGMDEALGRLRKAGFAASRTHFSPTAVRTDAPHKDLLRVVIG